MADMIPQRRIFLLTLLTWLLLAGCGPAVQSPTGQPTVTPLPATTEAPTPVPAALIYVSSETSASDPDTSVLGGFANDHGLQLKTVTALEDASFAADPKIVVLQSAPEDLGKILDAHPAVQFVLLGSSELTGKANLSTVSARQEDLYFMAGYLSTLIADDWRSAGLVVSDGPLGASAAEAFYNGGKYVCGKCNPSYPPVVDLPQVRSLAANAAPADWLAAANEMLQSGVRVMFVDTPAAAPEVINAVTSMGAYLVGFTPPVAGDGVSNWAATVTSDASGALQQVLENALKGQGGQAVTVQVTLAEVNPEFVSPGRQDLFNQVASLVAAGEIGTLSIP
jgi:basic membrane lipoprotein Med (substrate-binding protein (PBP1-ABC) superfamily)